MKKKTHKNSSSSGSSVMDLIKQDHDHVKSLFEAFQEAEDQDEKGKIAEEVMAELNVHTLLEEEIFYPAYRQLLEKEEDLEIMDEALEEHHVVHLLIKELEALGPDGERYTAKFKVLQENVEHHIQEEESQILSKAKKTEANSPEIAERMLQRKEELKNVYAVA